MKTIRTAFLHYTAPPVVGGVEAVIEAHARAFLEAGYPVTIVAGRGDPEALPEGAELVLVPEMDTQDPQVLEMSAALEQGQVPESFAQLRDRLAASLDPILRGFDLVIVHNVFTKHFNLALTAALYQLLDTGAICRCMAWCHDISWTSPHSQEKLFPGYPWDLLRTDRADIAYVVISEQRQAELAELLARPAEKIEIVYNGVDPCVWYGLTPEGWRLVQQMDLLSADLILLMPVRVTQAKNIELAARVLAALKRQECNTRLVVTGPPDPHDEHSMAYYRSLLDLRSSLGLVQELRFVFEAGPDKDEAYLISQQVVADLMRVSDVVFMPSHREGFGIPVVEAGLVGVPVVASDHIPAARELGSKNVYLFDSQAEPEQIARLIRKSTLDDRRCRFRRQVRQHFTWERIFRQKIEPHLRAIQAALDQPTVEPESPLMDEE